MGNANQFHPASGDPLFERGLPSNKEAERSILGAILLDNNAADQAAVLIRRDQFFLQTHRIIYEKMLDLRAKGSPIDLITLTNALGENLQRIGGATYISSLIDGVPRTDDISHYAKIVEKKDRFRRLHSIGQHISQLALDEEDDAIDQAEALVFNIGQGIRDGEREARHAADVAAKLCDYYEAKALDPSKMIGLSTGYEDLDRWTLGLTPGLTILAARTSHGKTAMALNIGCNIAKKGGSVYFASLESSDEQIVQRILASEARVDSHRMRKGQMDREEWGRLNDALMSLVPTRYYIDDTPDPTPEELLSKCRRHKAKYGLDLLIVDHMQLMGRRLARKRRYRSVREGVMEVGSELIGISRVLEVPTLGLSQLNRDPEDRPNHKPQISDLAEAGTLDTDADVVIGLYREELYHPEPENEGICSVLFLKQRDGRVGEMKMAFIKHYTRFEDLAEQPPPGPEKKARYTGGRYYSRRDKE